MQILAGENSFGATTEAELKFSASIKEEHKRKKPRNGENMALPSWVMKKPSSEGKVIHIYAEN